jgi:DNA-binding response OmpR family regulator
MIKKMVVLVVDDEERIIYFLQSKLRVSGYEVLTARNGKEAFEQFHNNNPDIIVLDLVMPEMDGLEFLKELRAFSDVPVIILSAKSEDVDKIKGLTLGADDYLQKPFNPNELIARIEAISRRPKSSKKSKTFETLTLHGIHIDFQARTVLVKGNEEHLTRLEWLLLGELVQNMGHVVMYEELLTKVWGAEYRNDIQILRTWINRLRNKLEENPQEPKFILTVPKVGYICKNPSS